MKAFESQVYVLLCSPFFASPYFSPASIPRRSYSTFHGHLRPSPSKRPFGTTTHNISNGYALSFPLGYGVPMGSDTLSCSITPHALHLHAPSPFDLLGFPDAQTTASSSFLGNLNGRDKVGKQPVDHVIQYLNKVKARYADDNITYEQFSDILRAYHKETEMDVEDVSIIITFSSNFVTLQCRVRFTFKCSFYSRIFSQKQPRLFLARTA